LREIRFEEVIQMADMKESIREMKRGMGALTQAAPEQMKGFHEFMGSVMEPGALDAKTKELVALGMALTSRCKYCIGIHTQGAFKAGATEQEIWEVATVAVVMGGGPALTHVAELYKALQEFSPEQA
jgi:AhpD family alkylhydroperoxidase